MTTTLPTLDDLKEQRLPELWERYAEVYGSETKCPNKTWLARQIIAGLEAKAEAEQLADDAPAIAEQALTDGTVQDEEEAADLEAILREQAAQEAHAAGSDDEGATTLEGEEEGTEGDDRPAPRDDPWSGATTVADRIPHIRALTTTAEVDALLATSGLQARVRTELEAHRKALAKVEDLDEEDPATVGALKALLGNRRTHARPGVLALVQQRLEALDPEAAEATPTKPLGDMDLDELRATYEAEVGRPTDSEHAGYLTWKIREARKGRITVGPARQSKSGAGEMKVVPLRIDTELLDSVDEAWQAEGYSSRVAFIRVVLSERVGDAK